MSTWTPHARPSTWRVLASHGLSPSYCTVMSGATVQPPFQAVPDVEAESIEAQSGAGQQFAGKEAEVLLHIASAVGDVCVRRRRHANGVATDTRIEADINLCRMHIAADGQQPQHSIMLLHHYYLSITTLFQSRIMLLNAVTIWQDHSAQR